MTDIHDSERYKQLAPALEELLLVLEYDAISFHSGNDSVTPVSMY
jgi:hypothetical protein